MNFLLVAVTWCGTPCRIPRSNRRRLAAAYLYTQQSRFAATLPSLGGLPLMLLTHLQSLGGTTALSALAEALGVKANRLSQLVAKLETIGLVTKPDHYTIQPGGGWVSCA